VRNVPDDRLLELSLVENIQGGEQLNPIEKPRPQNLHAIPRHDPGRTGRAAGEGGVHAVANALRLLKIPRRQALVAEEPHAGTCARLLLSSGASPAEMTRAANEMVKKGWSVRDAERWAQEEPVGPARRPSPGIPTWPQPLIACGSLLGTKSEIVAAGTPTRRTNRIHFFGQEVSSESTASSMRKNISRESAYMFKKETSSRS